jgi:hypothetical protein
MTGVVDIGDVRFWRAIEQLHRRGPRAYGEMLIELAATRLLRTEIEALVMRYAGIDPDVLRAAGGDRFAPLPLHVVARGPDRVRP